MLFARCGLTTVVQGLAQEATEGLDGRRYVFVNGYGTNYAVGERDRSIFEFERGETDVPRWKLRTSRGSDIGNFGIIRRLALKFDSSNSEELRNIKALSRTNFEKCDEILCSIGVISYLYWRHFCMRRNMCLSKSYLFQAVCPQIYYTFITSIKFCSVHSFYYKNP